MLLAAGVGRLLLARILGEGVNQSGLVPGVATGFVLVSVGACALLAAGFARRRLRWRLAIPAVLSLWIVSSMALLVAGGGPVVDYARGLRGIVGLLVFFGFFLTIATVGTVLVLHPAMHALGWLADRVPPLARRRVGDALRRGGRPRL